MKQVIRLSKSELHNIINESVRSLLAEKRNIRSQKLYDILQKHRGFNSNAWGCFSDLSDDNIIGVVTAQELRDMGNYNTYGRKMGWISGKEDIEHAELGDGMHLLYVWNPMTNCDNKAHDRRLRNHVDGKKLYIPPTEKAYDARWLRTNPFFINGKNEEPNNTNQGMWNRKTADDAMNNLRNGNNRFGNTNKN